MIDKIIKRELFYTVFKIIAINPIINHSQYGCMRACVRRHYVHELACVAGIHTHGYLHLVNWITTEIFQLKLAQS